MTHDLLLRIIESSVRDGTTHLNLSGQGLTSLPPEFARLSNLTSLDLSDNKLTSLPESIGQLSQLTKLDLRFQPVTNSPESLELLQEFYDDPYSSIFCVILS